MLAPASYTDAGGSVNSGPARNTTPVVEAIGALHFEGNVTPHAWYTHPLLRFDDGKANLVAITLLSDIVYWYRPTVLRDETSGRVVSIAKKFHADKLNWKHEERANHFGLTLRQEKDAIVFLKERGIIEVEVRHGVELPNGGRINNQVYIEPVPAMLAALSGMGELPPPPPPPAPETPPPAPPEPSIRFNGPYPPSKRTLPPVSTDTTPRLDGPYPPLKRTHTKTSSEISTNGSNVKRSGKVVDNPKEPEPEADAPPGEPIPSAVQRVAEEFQDQHSLRRLQQLHRIAEQHRCLSDWTEAEESTRRQVQRGNLKPENAGRYFNRTLTARLEARQIFIPPVGADARDEAAEASAALAGMFALEDAPNARN